MSVKHNYKQVTERYGRLKANLTKLVGNEAVNFAKDNFRKQGFEEFPGRVRKWKKRRGGAPRDKGRAILVDTGKGKRSIRVGQTTPTTVKIVTDTDYMQAHNDGLRIQGTARVRAHQRRTRTGKVTTVRAHTRQVNFQMPKRQFIGPSDELNRRVNKRYQLELIKVFK